MNGYVVHSAVLRDSDALLGGAAGQARAALAQVRRAAEAVHCSWRGPAGSAFHHGSELWWAGVAAMLDALDDIAALLGSSAAGYVATDDAVRTSLTR
jgi:WXG100 family type VII secretion target